MFSQIAQVFSSQGVILHGTQRVPVYKKAAPKVADESQDKASAAPGFDQASATVKWSQRTQERIAADKAARAASRKESTSADPAGSEAVTAKAAAAPDATSANGISDSAGEGNHTPATANGAEAASESDGPDAATSGKADAAKIGKTETPNAGPKKADGKPLSEEEQKQVDGLQKRDRQVKAHEAAHEAAAGGNARGGAAYEYQTGPDGRQYAVGGHVDIDVSPVRGNAQATLQKAQTVQRAALAPADPSGQDRAVAAAAAQMATQAQSEMAKQSGERTGAEASGAESPANPESRESAFDPRAAYARQSYGQGSNQGSKKGSRLGAGVSVYA